MRPVPDRSLGGLRGHPPDRVASHGQIFYSSLSVPARCGSQSDTHMDRQVNRTKINKAQPSVPTGPPVHLPDQVGGRTKTQPPRGHVVLASADSDSYRSLRRRPMSRSERFKLGISLRQQVPRSSMGDWKAPANRPDPVEQIMHSHEGRLDWLIPIRVGRMVASPYGFLRGTAVVMAEDVAHLPATGITPVICGGASGLMAAVRQLETLYPFIRRHHSSQLRNRGGLFTPAGDCDIVPFWLAAREGD